MHAVASWMQSNRLQLNRDKTEVLWCTITRRQHQLPKSPLSVDGTPINPVQSVQQAVSQCFAVLRQLRSIRYLFLTSMLQTLIVSSVLSRLDYGNAVLVGLPVHLYRRLQSVMNARLQPASIRPHLRCSSQPPLA